ncbi:MAG: cupin domain-containing protein [Candidatus Peribacteraceae bacterium]|nr:cupin domain-containing protein [Candidatus Peribacteraceae bacterium]
MKPKIKPKPWGREIWFAAAKGYAGKILEVRKGARLSLQFHERKEETQFLFSGRIRLTFGADAKKLRTKILKPGDSFHIPPKMIHRIEGLAPLSKIFEVSTSELDDVIKLDDDYGRSGSGNNESLDRQLSRRG